MLNFLEPGFEVDPVHHFYQFFQIQILNQIRLGFFYESRSDRFDWPVWSSFQNTENKFHDSLINLGKGH